MTFQWLKSILPKGLYGRTAMILLVPVITIQLVVSIVFIQRHFDGVTRQMSVNISLDIQLIAERINASADQAGVDAVIRNLAEPLGYTMQQVDGTEQRQGNFRNFSDLTGKNVIMTLRNGIPEITLVDLASSDREVQVQIKTDFGAYALSFSRDRISASAPHQLLVLMLVISVLMTLISIIFLRNQVRPIRKLARAAEAFGRGRNAEYRVSGATEVRAAGQAFLDMRARIERHIEQRTLMLSGVSHDLRTPLTRLKLGLSLYDQNEETAELSRDVDDMELMLDEFLAFARGDSLEQTVRTDPVSLIAQIGTDFQRQNHRIDIRLPDGDTPVKPVGLRPNAIKRALENLLNNAVRYGSICRLSLEINPKTIVVTVEDNGPGIPPAQREMALRPFMRLDEARNQDHGTGVGLGLSIVMDIASSHGGALDLSDSDDLGGLKVVLTLPR